MKVRYVRNRRFYKFYKFKVFVDSYFSPAGVKMEYFVYGYYRLLGIPRKKYLHVFLVLNDAFVFIDEMYAVQADIDTRQMRKECAELIEKHGLGV